jgi:hypothetical protein
MSDDFRIFAGRGGPWFRTTAVRPVERAIRVDDVPAQADPASVDPLAFVVPGSEGDDSTDAAILTALDSVQREEGSIEARFGRIEYELTTLFKALAPQDARELQRRLVQPSTLDVVALAFARLESVRRARLCTILESSRRRT